MGPIYCAKPNQKVRLHSLHLRSDGPFHCYRSNGSSSFSALAIRAMVCLNSLLLLLEQWSVFILCSCYRSDGPSPFPTLAMRAMVCLNSLLLVSEQWSLSIPCSCYRSDGPSPFPTLAMRAMVCLNSLHLLAERWSVSNPRSCRFSSYRFGPAELDLYCEHVKSPCSSCNYGLSVCLRFVCMNICKASVNVEMVFLQFVVILQINFHGHLQEYYESKCLCPFSGF